MLRRIRGFSIDMSVGFLPSESVYRDKNDMRLGSDNKTPWAGNKTQIVVIDAREHETWCG